MNNELGCMLSEKMGFEAQRRNDAKNPDGLADSIQNLRGNGDMATPDTLRATSLKSNFDLAVMATLVGTHLNARGFKN